MDASVSLARTCARLVAPALLTLLVWVPVAAQSRTSDLVNPASISFDHDGRNVTGFVAYITAEGAPPLRIDLGPIRPDGTGKVVARIPVLPPGRYSLEIAAYNQAGESPRVPASPGRFLITEQKADSPVETKSAPPSRQAEATPPSPEPKPAKKDPPKPKRGFLGKFYGVVVGSDDDEGGK